MGSPSQLFNETDVIRLEPNCIAIWLQAVSDNELSMQKLEHLRLVPKRESVVVNDLFEGRES
jgi:hypothetical protein